MRIAESYFKGVGHNYLPPLLLRVDKREENTESLLRIAPSFTLVGRGERNPRPVT